MSLISIPRRRFPTPSPFRFVLRISLVAALLLAGAAVSPGAAFGRAWLGVSLQAMTPDLRDALGFAADRGAIVSDVVPDSPADRAGLRPKDLILRVDDGHVETPADLVASIESRSPGDRVRLLLLRDSREQEILVELAEADRRQRGSRSRFPAPRRPDSIPGAGGRRLGVRAMEIDADLAPYFGTEEGRGLVVLGVQKGSPAERAGIRTGDLLLRFGGTPLSRVETLAAMIRTIAPDERWRIEAVRHGERLRFEGTGEELRTDRRRPPARHSRGPAWSPGHLPDAPRESFPALKRRIDRLERRLQRLERELRWSRRR